MYSIYRLKVDELDAQFVDSLKSLFKGKEIEIMVTPAEDQNYQQQNEDEKIMQQRSILQAIEEEDIKRFV